MNDQRNDAEDQPATVDGLKTAAAVLDDALARFCSRLDQLDEKCRDQPDILDALDSMLRESIRDMQTAAEAFERAVGQDKRLIKEAQSAFHKRTDRQFSKSYFMTRARTWPQGYPGDYLTLEGVYRNYPLSNGIGLYLDRYFLSTTLAAAVRGREDKLRELLKTELDSRKEPRVLDIACGPCREVLKLAQVIKDSGSVITCLDHDAEALTFSQNRISNTGYASNKITFRKYNAVKMVNAERNAKEFGNQDVIYSVGFFDYLSDDVLVSLLPALIGMLNPGGCLIASFKDCRRYTTFDYHWLVDWSAFLQRTEEDMWKLFEKANIPPARITTTRDETGVILFFMAAR